MLTKFIEWTRKPITWGGYLKLCGVGMLISVLTSLVWTIVIYWDGISEKIDGLKDRIDNLSFKRG